VVIEVLRCKSASGLWGFNSPLSREKITTISYLIRKEVEFCHPVRSDQTRAIRLPTFIIVGMNNPSIEKMRLFIPIVLLMSGLMACQDHSFPVQIQNLKNNQWAQNQVLNFEFKTQSPGEQVDLLYQVQYGPDYPFENIWLRYWLIGPKNDTLITSKDNLFLFEPGIGKPIGTGTQNRIYLDAYFLKNVQLKNPGTYKIKLRHYMRKDSLSGIQSFGVKVKVSE
jgi:gliding motility-associated lipoprotein GldH